MPRHPKACLASKAGFAICLAVLNATPASAEVCKFGACKAVSNRTYELKILSVSPDHAVEFTKVTVNYRLSSHVTTVTGSSPPKDTVLVCPEYRDETLGVQPCDSYPNLSDDLPVNGTIVALAPIAGDSPTLRLNLDRLVPPSGGSEFPITVKILDDAVPYVTSAMFKFQLDGFTALQVRAARTDTVWATLFGIVKSDPPHASENPNACNIVGANYCLPMTRIENVQANETVETALAIGPYEFVPNVGNELRTTVLLTNLGDDTWIQELGEGFANAFSMIGMIALSTYGAQSGNSAASGGAGGLHQAMEKLHGAAFAGCDGELVEDTFIFQNKAAQTGAPTLDSMTHTDGFEKFPSEKNPSEKIYVSDDGNVRCEDDGRYRLVYSLRRTSWKALQPTE